MEGPEDIESLKTYAESVKKRLEDERERAAEEKFLHSSLRGSDRLKAIEKYKRLQKRELLKHPEFNEAFEHEESLPSKSELSELIRYLQTKFQSIGSDEEATDADQWEWLLRALSDPKLAKAYLMHEHVATAYEKCNRELHPQPRHLWPVLPGSNNDLLEAIQHQLVATLQQPIPFDAYTINHVTNLHNILRKSVFKYFLHAMDGLANTWLSQADAYRREREVSIEEEEEEEENRDSVLEDEKQLSPGDDEPELGSADIEESVVSGCYATLAYDENGRDSYNEHGIRLKYVVFQKGDNEFLGATVRLEKRSILIARIVNGGLAQKTNLLHEGDELLSANGIELLGKDLNTVTEILSSLHGRVVLLVAPTTNPYAKQQPGTLIHLRALFSYEPEEDQFIACRELGLQFTKGDIMHVTGRRDPNWWQAYRNDEETGITGSVDTLAGLIPSPLYQRQRAILRLQSWLNSSSHGVELEDEPSDLEQSAEHPDAQPKEKRLFGFKLPFQSKRSSIKKSPSVKDLQSADDVDQSQSDMPQTPGYLMNSALVSSIYGRMSGQARPSIQPNEDTFEEWSAAGPVWGQHGFDMQPRRGERGRHRKNTSKISPCMEGILVPDMAMVDSDDPVAWLDKEVSRGFLCHPSLWTYEPIGQYMPQPLRRRPLVFVGPAHVGRHQLMQQLIAYDSNRFCSASIHTTKEKMKSDPLLMYIYISEENFEAERKLGTFVECGVFNKAHYGTSHVTLRNLVNNGKVCCITLRPDSLKRMRSSGLLPYVLFISPPDRVDDLRRIQKQMNLRVECSDMELKSCIECSRAMELRYGHWFDMVLVPETIESAVEELVRIATRLEREPSWVPRYWL